MVELPAVRFSLEGRRLTLDLAGSTGDIARVFLAKLPGYVRVQLTKPGKPRTTGPGSQSHHLNGHVQQIAIETGNDFEAVKLAAKHEAISMGYPFRTIGHQVVPYSETELTTEQAGILIEALHRLAAELDIRLREE